jgi:hypothetical protein
MGKVKITAACGFFLDAFDEQTREGSCSSKVKNLNTGVTID